MSDPEEYDTFGCHPFENNPATPDRIAQQVFVRRQVSDWNVNMKDGTQLQFWGFKDPDVSGSDSPWPSKTIRVKQGQIFHCEFKPSKGAHTIHWHGIEPTPMNDGVGHTSFEVKSSYTYQWCAHQAGTYLYHCHKNTVLHFEMGMYGVLIIDPVTKSPDTNNPNYLYDPRPGSTRGPRHHRRRPLLRRSRSWCSTMSIRCGTSSTTMPACAATMSVSTSSIPSTS